MYTFQERKNQFYGAVLPPTYLAKDEKWFFKNEIAFAFLKGLAIRVTDLLEYL